MLKCYYLLGHGCHATREKQPQIMTKLAHLLILFKSPSSHHKLAVAHIVLHEELHHGAKCPRKWAGDEHGGLAPSSDRALPPLFCLYQVRGTLYSAKLSHIDPTAHACAHCVYVPLNVIYPIYMDTIFFFLKDIIEDLAPSLSSSIKHWRKKKGHAPLIQVGPNENNVEWLLQDPLYL